MRRTMRTQAIIVGAGLTLGLFAVGPAPDIIAGALHRAGPLDELMWFTGCWQFDSPRGPVVRERWRLLPGDTLWGASVTMRRDSVVARERMHIVAREEAIVLVAEPEGQQRTEFRATTAGRTGAVFENAGHDFPQRITYRPSGDSLYARIDGVVNGTTRAIDFPMGRTECIPR